MKWLKNIYSWLSSPTVYTNYDWLLLLLAAVASVLNYLTISQLVEVFKSL